ncbi:hypothetical protein F5Y13DRAFT_203506 [Hypoxylon sp. FL1857]|nr:hypothetical protein F5Y13DRAFT_203506 [Hypoxylon sp. FL1857]
MEPSPTGGFHEADGATNRVIEPDGSTIPHCDPPDTVNEPPSLIQRCMLCFVSIIRLNQAIKFSWVRLSSSLDSRTAIRFAVAIFCYLMGITTTLSVSIAPNRPADALPSLVDDGYPIMVAQVIASLLSPLLFSIVSTKEHFIPIRQKILSFYYILLIVGVLMSFASLLLYSLWPAGYRVTNITIIGSLMFTVLGGWQFLEKCWKEAKETSSANDDIELGLQQV